MCGIVGYVGQRPARALVVDALRRMEYRGYDSAGVALFDGRGGLTVRRRAGRLANLEAALDKTDDASLVGTTGLGHTRWATHGRPSEENAHPHSDCTGNLVVVHNGIIENYLPLKAKLQAAGHRFVTQTDTEVVAHLVESLYEGSLEEAVRAALRELTGIYALVLVHKDEPQKLVAARMGPPLVVGLAVVAICTWANTIGAMVPLLAHRLRLDPALVSAPLITTLVDATGLAIYLLIAQSLLAL